MKDKMRDPDHLLAGIITTLRYEDGTEEIVARLDNAREMLRLEREHNQESSGWQYMSELNLRADHVNLRKVCHVACDKLAERIAVSDDKYGADELTKIYTHLALASALHHAPYELRQTKGYLFDDEPAEDQS